MFYADDSRKVDMFSKKIRGGKTLQSGRKVGLGNESLRTSKNSQDLRSSLSQKKATKMQGRVQVTSKSKAVSSVGDARRKITSKKSQVEPVLRSISLLDERRKEQRQNLHQQNRSLTLSTGGNIQVTTRQEVPPDRMATVMGDSIQITAKVERRNEDMDRQANVIAGFLTITAKNEDTKKQRGSQLRKKERQNEARKREQEPERVAGLGRRRKDQRERALYSETAEDNHVYESNVSRPQASRNLTVGKSGASLEHGSKRNGPQMGKGSTAMQAEDEDALATSRITVSNLHPAVTQQDVEELFGAIGSLKSCKMLSRGCAEVVYAQKRDALIALSRYHNRKLDGQPMQCKLNTLPSAPLYSPPPARLAPLAPLAPLRPTVKSSPRPLPSSVPEERQHRPPAQTTQAMRPVVFKVRI